MKGLAGDAGETGHIQSRKMEIEVWPAPPGEPWLVPAGPVVPG